MPIPWALQVVKIVVSAHGVVVDAGSSSRPPVTRPNLGIKRHQIVSVGKLLARTRWSCDVVPPGQG